MESNGIETMLLLLNQYNAMCMKPFLYSAVVRWNEIIITNNKDLIVDY